MRLKSMREISKPDVVYNLHVKTNHNYFANGALAKNCHLATGKSISTIVKNMSHCEYKFGLSGSLKDGKANVLQYVGMFGDVFRPVDTAKLMEDGQVAQLNIKTVMMKYPEEECKNYTNLNYQQEIKVITNHKKRNSWVCALAKKLASRDENVLVLFKHTEHGKWMYEKLKAEYGEKVHYISGETKSETRVELRGAAENDTGLIIVASYGVLSTGVSIKRLHHLILAHGVKSKILVLQSIGRVLRKHGTKVEAIVWDIVDILAMKTKSPNAKSKYKKINYCFKHGLERISRYNQEKFSYQIVKVEL